MIRKLMALVAMAVALGSCGGGGDPEVAADARPTPVTQEQIEQVLLSADELPAGYTVAAAEGGAADLVLCAGIAELRKEMSEEVSARARFTGPDQISTVGQETYFDAAGTRGVEHLRRVFAACDQVTVTVQGRKVELKVSERSFDRYGEESAAFRVSGALLGLPFGADFAAVSQGGVVNLVYAAGLGSDHGEQLEKLVEITYAKQERVTGG
jgi:hypothetical protein